METNTITKEQLNKLVDRIEEEFHEYFTSDKSQVDSLHECFYTAEIYKEEGLLTLDQDVFHKLPKDIQEKTHELIAEFTKVD
ncbi:hypothetical protein [Sphingobacterium chuzhouense]|uniref:Colicin D immunity protein domain-containing protein n=1 Tax=Sphingobacterium chuzhouense TaxID=1742264 RepID=A0ABR7XU22_9SPHI|nr:hypothetical protein [Sphingobacterium chuzhouense]MBD1422359.1 hypothetical protein [Sphingobacterium chuzhouense]